MPELDAYDDRLDEYEKEKYVEEHEEKKQSMLQQKPKIATLK